MATRREADQLTIEIGRRSRLHENKVHVGDCQWSSDCPQEVMEWIGIAVDSRGGFRESTFRIECMVIVSSMA